MSSAVDALPALDTIPGGVLSLSDDLRILAANGPMAALVGRSVDELVGAPIDLLLSAPSRILFQTHVYPALRADGRVEEVLLTLATGSGEITPVLFNAVRSGDHGAAGAGAGVAYDALVVRIRARSRWESDLLEATRALEGERAASRKLAEDLALAIDDLRTRMADDERNRKFRDAFVGVVSHELRTPITTIFGMAHVLRRSHRRMTPEMVDSHLDDIVAESDRLRRLTEDLLILNRAEGGGLTVAADPVVLSRVIERAVEGERTRSPEHRIEVDAAPGLPLVSGEDVYIEQVLRNYLGNATKYSPPGTLVSVTARAEDDGVAIRVLDEGPGLRDEDPERLFELFYRSKSAIAHKQGAGIGLFVCRELIHAMGGRVWAAAASASASAPGSSGASGSGSSGASGAEFGFWLPAVDADDGE